LRGVELESPTYVSTYVNLFHHDNYRGNEKVRSHLRTFEGGRRGYRLPALDVPEDANALPASLLRGEIVDEVEVSEVDVIRTLRGCRN